MAYPDFGEVLRLRGSAITTSDVAGIVFNPPMSAKFLVLDVKLTLDAATLLTAGVIIRVEGGYDGSLSKRPTLLLVCQDSLNGSAVYSEQTITGTAGTFVVVSLQSNSAPCAKGGLRVTCRSANASSGSGADEVLVNAMVVP
jgi:hypothetical protein